MRWFRRLVFLLIVVLAATLGGVYALLQMADPDKLARDGARQLGLVLGHEVSFGGTPQAGMWPVPGIETGPITGGGQTLQGGTAVVVPDPLALITGKSRVLGVVLIGSSLTFDRQSGLAMLERNAERANGATLRYLGLLAGTLQTGADAAPMSRVSALATLGGGDRRFGLRLSGDWDGRSIGLVLHAVNPRNLFQAEGTDVELDLDIGDTHVSYAGLFGREDKTGRIVTDGRGTARVSDPAATAALLGVPLPAFAARMSELDAEFESRTLNTALRLKTNMAVRLGERTLSLQASISGPAGWRDEGPDKINVVSRGGGLFSAYLSGEFDGPDKLAGAFTVSVADAQGVQDLLGMPKKNRLIEITRGTLTADYEADPDGVRFTGGRIRMGERSIPTTLAVKFGKRPLISVGLDLPELDLTAAQAAAYSGLRTTLSWIEDAGTDVALVIRSAKARLGDLELGRVELGLVHRDGVARIELGRIEVMNGLANGRLNLATRGPARLSGDFALAEVDADALSRRAGLGLLDGTVDGFGSLKVPDLSLPRATGLSISGVLKVTDGSLKVPMASADAIAFHRADMKLSLADGRVRAHDIALHRDGQTLSGELDIALQDRKLTGYLAMPDNSGLTIDGNVASPTSRAAIITAEIRKRMDIPPAGDKAQLADRDATGMDSVATRRDTTPPGDAGPETDGARTGDAVRPPDGASSTDAAGDRPTEAALTGDGPSPTWLALRATTQDASAASRLTGNGPSRPWQTLRAAATEALAVANRLTGTGPSPRWRALSGAVRVAVAANRLTGAGPSRLWKSLSTATAEAIEVADRLAGARPSRSWQAVRGAARAAVAANRLAGAGPSRHWQALSAAATHAVATANRLGGTGPSGPWRAVRTAAIGAATTARTLAAAGMSERWQTLRSTAAERAAAVALARQRAAEEAATRVAGIPIPIPAPR